MSIWLGTIFSHTGDRHRRPPYNVPGEEKRNSIHTAALRQKALGLNTEQNVPILRKDIQKHLRTHPQLADNPKFAPIFSHRPQPKVASKNRADKAGEEETEVPNSGGTITGANRTLFEQTRR
ncbi:hypothetical protein C8R45DRAFT_935574 [Mycena sanguinolenta]|nr:hypothetical protein C8R45DRAFT_935574 [Mycena sanguinolenta]